MPVCSRLARKVPSIRPTVGKFWTPAKPMAFRRSRNGPMDTNGSVPLTPCQYRRVVDHPLHLACHVDDNVIGIAIGQQAGERATAGHAVAPRVVHHDEVDVTGFFALGGQAGAGTVTARGCRRGDRTDCCRLRAETPLSEAGGLESFRLMTCFRLSARPRKAGCALPPTDSHPDRRNSRNNRPRIPSAPVLSA